MNRYVLSFNFCVFFLFVSCGGDSSDSGSSSGTTDTNTSYCTVTKYIPFNYTVENDHVAISTSGGTLKTVIHPWGSSTPLHTGHFYGDTKSNWHGLFAFGHSDFDYYSGSAPCDPATDTCGVSTANISNYIPIYISPQDELTISSVKKVRANDDGADYFGDSTEWEIRASLCGHDYILDHLGAIKSAFCTLMVNAGNTNPCTYSGSLDVELVSTGFTVDKDTEIATPQIHATEIAGHSGYWKGPSHIGTPMAQIEFTIKPRSGDGEYGSWYKYLTDTERTEFKDAMFNAVSTAIEYDSGIYIYANGTVSATEWLWRGDMRLESIATYLSTDYSSITSRFGDWWEYGGSSCTQGNTLCDDTLFITPISKDTAIYNSSLYDSANTSYFVLKYTYGAATTEKKWGEIVGDTTINDISDQITVKWRMDGNGDVITKYQGLAYYLNSTSKILKVRYGSEVTTIGAVVMPAIPSDSDSCDGATLKCLNGDGFTNPTFYGHD